MNKKKNPPLKELVDLSELQLIQDSFAEMVGTSSVIFSPEGEALTEFSNPTGFCSLIQSTATGKERCFQSFQEMVEGALKSEEPGIMYCFAHGGHFVAPIVIGGEHKGTMFAGQFTPSEFSEGQLDDIRQIAGEIDMDPGTLLAEAEQMRVVREDAVRNYSSLLFRIVGIIAKLGAQAAELSQVKDVLQEAYDKLKVSYKELSIPVIQVWDGVLVLPIIGVLDNERINRLMETMLAKIVKTHSRVVILDVTGVRSIDTNVANDLINVTKAAKLLGTTCIITGIRPEAAHTLVGLGVDMLGITTKRSMQEGLKYALQIAGARGVDA